MVVPKGRNFAGSQEIECELAVNTNHTAGCLSRNTANRTRETIAPFHLVPLKLHPEHLSSSGPSITRGMLTNWGETRGRAAAEGLKDMTFKVGMCMTFVWGRQGQKDLYQGFQCLKEDYRANVARCQREKNFTARVVKHWSRFGHGGFGVAICGDFQN